MKKTFTNFIILFFMLCAELVNAQVPGPAPIAFAGFHTDNQDGFALVALDDITAGNDEIYVTDGDYDEGSNEFDLIGSFDDFFKITWDGVWKKGTIIRVVETSSNVLTVTSSANGPMNPAASRFNGNHFSLSGTEGLSIFNTWNGAISPGDEILHISAYIEPDGAPEENPNNDSDCPCSPDFVDINFGSSSVDNGNFDPSLRSGAVTLADLKNTSNWVVTSTATTLSLDEFTNLSTGALPVELVSFNANTINEKDIQLTWQTASELNNLGFEIERSANGSDWEFLDFVGGRGTTNEFQSYSFIDDRPMIGHNYYRLKQIDFDGKFEYSDIRSVLIGSPEQADLQVFPNPNDGQFLLSLLKPAESDASIRVYGSEGNLIFEKYVKPSEELGHWKQELNLPAGKMYYVVSYVGDKVISQKIIARSKR